MGIIRTKANVHRRGEQTVEAAMSSNNGDLVMKILRASVFAAVAAPASAGWNPHEDVGQRSLL
jgi:hypothetical protein